MGTCLARSPKIVFAGQRFIKVIAMGRCPMGIDIADIVRRDSAVRNGSKHAFCRHLPARIRSRDVIGITVIAVADDFGIDMGTAFFGVFQFFKDNDTRAFAP